MAEFSRSRAEVSRVLERAGLGFIMATVSRIRPVREESFHDSRDNSIGLNPRDVRRPFAAFHRRSYLLVHELGHHFAEACLTREDRTALVPLFGDYDAPYRRSPKPRRCDRDHVSRYAMTHPAEDFAETFAVCLWELWERGSVRGLLAARGPACRRKAAAMRRLLRNARAFPACGPGPLTRRRGCSPRESRAGSGWTGRQWRGRRSRESP